MQLNNLYLGPHISGPAPLAESEVDEMDQTVAPSKTDREEDTHKGSKSSLKGRGNICNS